MMQVFDHLIVEYLCFLKKLRVKIAKLILKYFEILTLVPYI